jgi:hypothetical protein
MQEGFDENYIDPQVIMERMEKRFRHLERENSVMTKADLQGYVEYLLQKKKQPRWSRSADYSTACRSDDQISFCTNNHPGHYPPAFSRAKLQTFRWEVRPIGSPELLRSEDVVLQ